MSNRKLWTEEEDTIIVTLIQKYGVSQWTTIASEMKNLTSTPRSSKQIRERWHNQLSPNVFKAPWSAKEEAELFEAHSILGSKWKEIAVQFSGRTDNAVKNHFYSTVRRALRRLDKHFGFRDSTRKMRDLKPSALTHFLEAAQQTSFYSEMMSLILTFAQWKPTRQNRHTLIEHPRELYSNIIELIINHRKEEKPKKKDKIEEKGLSETIIDISSTELEKIENNEESEGGQSFNYFGGQVQTQSWFSIHQKDQQLQIDGNLLLPCDYCQ